MKHPSFFLATYLIEQWKNEVEALSSEECCFQRIEEVSMDNFHGGLVLAEIQTPDDLEKLYALLGHHRHSIAILGLMSCEAKLETFYSHLDDFILPSERHRGILRLKAERLCAMKRKEFRLSMLEKEIQRHQGDLKLAKHIQDIILTEIPPSIPSLEIDVKFKTTGLVGGDLCDFQMMSNQYAGIFLADVSGHGIGSALIASMTKILFKTFTSEINNPRWFLSNLNTVMVDILMPVEKFITAFYGIYHNYRLVYINAGHISPFVYSPSTDSFRELLNTACILGYIKNIPMSATEIEVQPGDVMVFFTDGLIEAKSKKDEIFSIPRLQEFVRRNHASPQLASLILEEVEAYSDEGRGIEDDMTLVVAKVK